MSFIFTSLIPFIVIIPIMELVKSGNGKGIGSVAIGETHFTAREGLLRANGLG
jgi:hypothetical protein